MKIPLFHEINLFYNSVNLYSSNLDTLSKTCAFSPLILCLQIFVCIFSDPAAGASDDWYRGGLGVRYAFTTELRYNYVFWITHSKLGSLVHYPKKKRLFMYF